MTVSGFCERPHTGFSLDAFKPFVRQVRDSAECSRHCIMDLAGKTLDRRCTITLAADCAKGTCTDTPGLGK